MVSMRHQETFYLQICERVLIINELGPCVYEYERFHGKEEENLGKGVAFRSYSPFPVLWVSCFLPNIEMDQNHIRRRHSRIEQSCNVLSGVHMLLLTTYME